MMQRRCWSRLMVFIDTVSRISATSPSLNVLSSSPLSSPVSWLSPEEAEALLMDVLPPMAENVRTEVCDTFGITEAMQDEVLPELHAIAAETGCTLLDYEWNGSCITDDDTQFFDGFHLDEKYGLPDWTEELFTDIG